MRNLPRGAVMANNLTEPGTELFNTAEKLFEDIKAEPGETAFTFMHTVPYEGSVGLVNRPAPPLFMHKAFAPSLVLYGPCILTAAGTLGFPTVGDEALPGHM